MTHQTKIAVAYLALAAVLLGALSLVAHYTVVPMTRNYKECGTIFLCRFQ